MRRADFTDIIWGDQGVAGQQEAGWAVVLAKPMSEEVAARSLTAAGYRVYLPMMRQFLKQGAKTR